MKKSIFYLLVATLFTGLLACEGPKKPELRDVRDVRVISFSNEKVEVEANAIIYNPNIIDLEITGADIKFTVNDVPSTDIVQLKNTVIPSDKEVGIPMRATFSPKDALKSGGNLLSMLVTQKATVKYQGDFTVKVGGISFEVPIDQQKQLDLNKKN